MVVVFHRDGFPWKWSFTGMIFYRGRTLWARLSMVVVFHGHDFLQWWYFMGQIFHGSGISWAWLSIKMIFNWHGFPWGGLLWAQFSTGVVFSWGDLPWGWSLNSCSAALQKDRQGRWTLTHRTVCWQPACLHRHGEPSRDTLASVPPSVGTALPPTSLPPADTNKYHTPQTLDMDKYTTENHQAAFTARLHHNTFMASFPMPPSLAVSVDNHHVQKDAAFSSIHLHLQAWPSNVALTTKLKGDCGNFPLHDSVTHFQVHVK